MTLEEFYAARLDEDEAAAQHVHLAIRCTRWQYGAAECTCGYPARVLREVEAGRKMLVRYEFACRQADVNTGAERESWEKIAGALERDVADWAAVWSDHPDYRQEWKP